MLFWRSPTQCLRQELSVQTQLPAHWPEPLQTACKPIGWHLCCVSRQESCLSEQHWQKWIALSFLRLQNPDFPLFNWSCSSQFSAHPDALHCDDELNETLLFNELMKLSVSISETNSGRAGVRLEFFASFIFNFLRLSTISKISSRKRSPALLLGSSFFCLSSWIVLFGSLTAFSTLIDLNPSRSSFINKFLARFDLVWFDNASFPRIVPMRERKPISVTGLHILGNTQAKP